MVSLVGWLGCLKYASKLETKLQRLVGPPVFNSSGRSRTNIDVQRA